MSYRLRELHLIHLANLFISANLLTAYEATIRLHIHATKQPDEYATMAIITYDDSKPTIELDIHTYVQLHNFAPKAHTNIEKYTLDHVPRRET